jgi:hypothetical protein
MKILFDQGTPAPLRRALTGHDVTTASEQGWANLANGDLLRAAEGVFDAFLSTDQGLRHQQNLSGRRLAIPPPLSSVSCLLSPAFSGWSPSGSADYGSRLNWTRSICERAGFGLMTSIRAPGPRTQQALPFE